MTKLKIAVDLDGVVWDIMDVFIDIYNRLYKEDVCIEDVDGWYYFPQERFEVVYPLTLPRIMEYPVINKFIYFYLFSLNKIYDVKILTAELNTIESLEEKLKSLSIIKGSQYNEIIKIDPKDSKLDYNFDVYIDDRPCMAKEILKFPKRYLLLYDQPWNRDVNDKNFNNVWRVYGWEEIMLAINRIRGI